MKNSEKKFFIKNRIKKSSNFTSKKTSKIFLRLYLKIAQQHQSMKKCIVCEKDIEHDEEICDTCRSFFQWKYEDDFEEKMKEFREYRDKKENYKIKFRRKK